jgi:hypothetical protein
MKTAGRWSLAGVVLLLAACAATPSRQQQAWGELVLYPQQRFDAVYVRPQASLAPYTEILLDPLQVSFDRNWDPRAGSVSLRDVDTARIKRVLAEEFRKVFEETLAADGKFRIVDAAGSATLHLSPAIIDLYINAPDASLATAGRVRSYTVDPGHMTLTLDIRDGASDTLLAHVIDRKEGVERSDLQVANSVTNTADARRVMKQWARAIREALDAARTLVPPAAAR